MSKLWRVTPRADIAIEDRADGEGPSITGLAAVYYDGTPRTEFKLGPNMVERIMPGAFSRALDGKDDVVALFNHDANQVLGRMPKTLQLTNSDSGLRYRITPPNTQPGRDTAENIRAGNVRGSSFSFAVTDQKFDTEDGVEVREIRGVELFDVGPVTFPAYKATTAEAASKDFRRSLDAWRNARFLTEIEERRKSIAADLGIALDDG